MGNILFNKKGKKVLALIPISKQTIASLFEVPNFYAVFFFEKAAGNIVMDGQEIIIKEHYILFYYPYQKLSLKGDFEGVCIQFHPDFFCIDIHAKDIGCQGVLFNNFFGDGLLRCSTKEYKKLSEFYSNLNKELLVKEMGQLDMVSSQLKIFLINAVRVKAKRNQDALPDKDNLHYQIKLLIDTNFFVESSPKFYANTLEVSLTTFNRLCHKYFQNSFINILNLKRIATAKNKLFLTNFPIKNIAYEVGYNDPLYFTRVFKKYTGISPKDFRKQLKNNRLV